jgi:putative addiction module component (TIGR02574 family)
MAILTKSEIAALSIDERLALIDDLWESIEERDEAFALSDGHREILDKRIEEADRHPETSVPWEVVRAELAEKRLR